jgi:hypothetical protein
MAEARYRIEEHGGSATGYWYIYDSAKQRIIATKMTKTDARDVAAYLNTTRPARKPKEG